MLLLRLRGLVRIPSHCKRGAGFAAWQSSPLPVPDVLDDPSSRSSIGMDVDRVADGPSIPRAKPRGGAGKVAQSGANNELVIAEQGDVLWLALYPLGTPRC